ncbi:unnamed protein product [Ranitomeya imitator]|uniref:Reverse transcriptase domain-containing protein n=1 Tax=Ranitomeya imitator TaxID=111125 RepID=A0ABN9LKY2_9NEOB|nr:unnamed protein product [Ranitomeya imitator]
MQIFMAKLESDFLSSCPIRPLAYYRYIDDILIIWTESEPQLKTFHDQFNQFHPTINLTLNYSCTEINFLDTIIKLQNNKIETSLYQKPIDRPTYLKWDSFHPKHIKNSIVYSQAIRYNRICSNPKDRDEHFGRLRKIFLNQGYHPRTTENQITRATRISRNHLLHYKTKEENNRVPLVVTYNPNLEVLRGAARKLQPLLQKDARLQSIFPDPPLLCFRQPPNLRSIIVKSSLSSLTAAGTFPCNQKKCKTCPFITTTDQINIPNSHQDYKIPGDPRRPYPTDLEMRSGLLGQMSNLPTNGVNGHLPGDALAAGRLPDVLAPQYPWQTNDISMNMLPPNHSNDFLMESLGPNKENEDDVEVMSTDSSSSSSDSD